jgi:DNA polymerase-3 subunit alpha
MFIHLRVHSSYSFLRGLTSPAELARAAAQGGMDALALTDHNSLTGAIEFYDACRAAGVRPILGLELAVAFPLDRTFFSVVAQPSVDTATNLLTLLALDIKGWRSLCRLSSALDSDQAILPFELLAQESTGLLCLTGGLRGALACLLGSGQKRGVSAWLGLLREVFSDRLYVELQQHQPEDTALVARLSDLAKKSSLPVSATHDIHYMKSCQADLQQVLASIRLIHPLEKLPSEAVALPGAYFHSPDEMIRLFVDYPQALAGTQEAADRCHLELPLGIPHFPEIELPAGLTAIEALKQKAENGAQHLYGQITAEIRAHLDHELSVINQCGYATLFLIVEDILNYARRQGVPTASRGSAASSLVAHCLGITSPDPLYYILYFERFLNPARATPPDIDTDLCSRRREEVIRYVYARFGQERVATVCTVNRFRSRSALREVAKAHGLSSEEVSELGDSLPHRWYGPPNWRDDKSSPYSDLTNRFTSPVHQTIFREAAALIGLPHHLSVHPGGMVIAPGPLTDLVPTQMAAKGVLITQFDLESIERLGLVKIDLLGIRGLTVLGDVAEAMAGTNIQPQNIIGDIGVLISVGVDSKSAHIENRSRPYSGGQKSYNLDLLDSIPEDDPATSDTILQARTIGCFQIESPGMRATLKEIRARSVEDILVALALYRPGPLSGGLKDAFVKRHIAARGESNGDGPLTGPYEIHPALTPLLADTHGVILYQEQVLRVAHELAGLSLADADLLRRAMSHFDPGKQMQTLREKFVAGAYLRSGVPEAEAGQIWDLMAAFAGYGFPKAHAASYAQVGWRSAWCKTHFPGLFMASVLANWGGYYSQRVYLTEARRMGLALRPPHISHASRQFSLKYIQDQPVLFMGLDQVRDLTRRTQEAIQREQPFHSFDDFLARVDPRPVEVENLVKVGALEGFGTIPAMLHQLKGVGWRGGQLSLFSFDLTAGEDWTLLEKVNAQEEILGTGVVAHPLELVEGLIEAAGAITTVEAAARLGHRVRVAGMRQTWRRSSTVHGDYVYFMALEDLEGMLNVMIFSQIYRACRSAFSTPGPYIVEGMVELERELGEPFIRAERVMGLTPSG